MAKSKSFFGLRRGSTKSLTFSVLNGQQVTKDRVYGGKNPRSLAQMVQRMCLATSSAAYSQMKQIVDHSFEGISYGANTMAEFIKVNTKLIKNNYELAGENFAYNPYGDRGLKVGAYQMAKGTATPISASVFNAAKGNGNLAVTILNGGAESVTANAIMASLGIAVGELATYCFMYAKAGSADDWAFGFIRITALQAGDVTLTSANIGQYLLIESNLNISSVEIASTTVVVTVSTPNDEGVITTIAQCAIHSLKSANGWLRSNAVMTADAETDIVPSAADALATYPIGESYVLNGGDIE